VSGGLNPNYKGNEWVSKYGKLLETVQSELAKKNSIRKTFNLKQLFLTHSAKKD
jgi:nucleoside diphosphate kinase